MPKKNSKKEQFDTDGFTTSSAIELAIIDHKDTLHRKVKIKEQAKEAKKEAAAAYREQIKELDEEIDFELGAIDSLIDRLKTLPA